MSEIVERIVELQALPEEQHLFCPRATADDASVYFPEDSPPEESDSAALAERKTEIKKAEARKWSALHALQILAFDGPEAAPFKKWLQTRLDNLMKSCDVCVRVFHQSKTEWKQKLLEQFDEDHVFAFLEMVDIQSLGRIQRGLDEAHQVLLKADPKKRGVRILPTEATYAIFEALSCDAVIRSEEFLQQHFDAPFQLVQTKKRLKLQTWVPAMSRFLFSRIEHRQLWAYSSWSTFKRNILRSEFDWAVREHLLNAMMRVQMNNLDLPFVAVFWAGVRLIVNKLDKELITTSIRDLEGDFYRLLLEHLSLNSEGFIDLVVTMKTILEKSPTDFWDAMDAITPSTATIVEQVFNSPILKQMLLAAKEEDETDMDNLHAAFDWINPFLSSIKPVNLPPAARAFANALLGRFQADQYSPIARAYCFREGLRVLDYTFRKMCEEKTEARFVGQPSVDSMLDILSTYIQLIVGNLKRLQGPEAQGDRQLVLSTIQYAFTLEATSLNIEKLLISKEKPSPTETRPSSPIWTAVLSAIDADNMDLATHLLLSGRNLIGLEPCLMKAGFAVSAPIKHFNGRFELLSKSITDIVDRMTEFSPKQLNDLFGQPAAASAIVSLLFSSTEDLRSSVIELLKVITDQEERRDALQQILTTHYKNVLVGISDSCRQVTRKRIFAPASSLLRTCTDIVDVLCNSQDGLLRSKQFEQGKAGVTMNFWKNLWNTLTMFFDTTEGWSILGVYEKEAMMNFCRDVMQFADYLFDQCSVFASALKRSPQEEEDKSADNELMKELLLLPAATIVEAKKWLRLRDEYLSGKAVTLIRKLLIRLHDVSIEIDPSTLTFIMQIVSNQIKAKLTMQQQAELQRAIEIHLDHDLVKEEEQPAKQQRQVSLDKFIATGSSKEPITAAEARANLMKVMTPTQLAFKENRELFRMKEAQAAKKTKEDEAKNATMADFRRKRQLELERQKKEKEAAIARARKDRGLTSVTAEAGSALAGLGILGRDNAPKGEGLMHSSDESEDDADAGDIDLELFGIKKRPSNAVPKTNIINEATVPTPVKKRRVARSAKDMKARLAPDLSLLHKTILKWDYFHEGEFPPHTKDNYTAVPSTFRTPNEYQATFGALLTLEAWQGFVKERAENTSKPYEIRITQRSTVDAFMEIGSTLTHNENRDIQVMEGDIILLSMSNKPSAQEPHCLARIFQVKRKSEHIQIAYRVMPGNRMTSSLNPNNTIFGTKIQSITPLEREYSALHGLQYYDLCDEIIRAKPSPLLAYKDSQLEPLMGNYKLNKAQAKAVKSAFDNDAFTLIQGPPGSGKTKTITAIVGAVLSDTLRKGSNAKPILGQVLNDTAIKKLLVCAPSNAAVDELVMRFKEGIRTTDGHEQKINIVRLGRSDAMNENVKDVTLDELVSKKLGVSNLNGANSEATRKLFEKHKQTSKELNELRDQMDSGKFQGEALQKMEKDFHELRRLKAQLGKQIDNAKDEEKTQSRNADINRRRAQEQVLREAHVVCATLSGSGHDMFQSIAIDFETVIVDEAAQCVEMSALIPLKYGCAKCILVGDPKQLPPTVFSKEAAAYQYEQSLFVRMQKNHPDDVHLLDTQYRMHPEISFYPSWTFYDGRLVDGGNMAALRKQPWHKSWLLGPYRFFDVKGQQHSMGHSLANKTEVNVALQLYARLTKDYPRYDFSGKVGIITPYKSQLRLLKERFIANYGPGITKDIMFNTTDAFQGREAEVIIFSCVRAAPSGGIGFLQDIRRMNVGLTRAKSSLWVLGNSQSLMRGQFWRGLVEDAQRRDRYTAGNLDMMLSKPSSAYLAPEGMFDEAVPVPMELGKRADERRSNQAETKPWIKQEPYARTDDPIKQEANVQASNKPYIKQEPYQNGKRSLDNDGDTKMSDGDDESETLNGSGASTSATPEPMEVVQRQHRIPKKRPRPPPNPLISRPPKKPRG